MEYDYKITLILNIIFFKSWASFNNKKNIYIKIREIIKKNSLKK